MPADRKRVRLLISVPLILCLLPVVTMPQLSWSFGLQKTAGAPETVIRDCEVYNPSVFTLDSRTCFSSFDGLFIDALTPGQIAFDSTPEPSERVAVFTPRFAVNANHRIVPIRAPPFASNT